MSDWIRPKFAYNDGGGIVDFSPTYPATKKVPAGDGPLAAIRHDSITTSGIKQSVVERVDEFIVLPFETIPEADLTSWKQFMKWAIKGNQFTYYPNAADGATYYEVTVEETDYHPTYVAYKTYSLTITLRIFVGTSQYYS